MGYEDDLVRFLQTLISDVERRIRRGQARLALTVSQQNVSIFLEDGSLYNHVIIADGTCF